MKRIKTKETLLLCIPAILLFGVGLALRDRPTLKLRSVQVKPTKTDGCVDVEVLVDYQEPWFTRFTEEPALWRESPRLSINAAYNAYVEDEQGRKYGKKRVSRDTKDYRPFTTFPRSRPQGSASLEFQESHGL